MLSVTLESDVKLSKESLEEIWPDNRVSSTPHLSEQFGPGLGETTFGTQGIIPLLVQWIFVTIVEEILGEFPGV